MTHTVAPTVITTPDGLGPPERRSVSRHPFLLHPWLSTWWRHFGAGKQLFVVDLSGLQRPIGACIAPLYFQRHGPFRVGYILGSGPVPTRGMGLADRVDLLAGPGGPAESRALARTLGPEPWDLLWLRALPDAGHRMQGAGDRPSGPAWTGFAEAAREQGWHVEIRPRSRSPYIELPPDWETYLASRSPELRGYTRKNRKRLERAGAVEIKCRLGPIGRAGAGELFDEFVKVNRESWTARAGTALLVPLSLQAFFRDLFLELAQTEHLAANTLRLDGQLLSYDFGFALGQAYGIYHGAYRRAFAHLSPGSVLTAAGIAFTIQRGFREFDLMRTPLEGDSYKFGWATGCRTEVDLIVTRPSFRSRLAAALLVDTRARLKASPAALRIRDWLWKLGAPRP